MKKNQSSNIIQSKNNLLSGSDTVHLSTEGKKLSDCSIRPAFSDNILNKAKNNPNEAEELAYNYAYNHDLLSIDIPESLKFEDTYYCDGTPFLDRKYIATFDNEAEEYRQKRIDLYESEKVKGSSDSDILAKLFNFYDNLPFSYQLKIGYL